MFPDEISELEHNLLTSENTFLFPSRECYISSFNGCLHLTGSGTRDATQHLISGRVVVVDPAVSLGLNELPIDKQLHCWLGRGEREGERESRREKGREREREREREKTQQSRILVIWLVKAGYHYIELVHLITITKHNFT